MLLSKQWKAAVDMRINLQETKKLHDESKKFVLASDSKSRL